VQVNIEVNHDGMFEHVRTKLVVLGRTGHLLFFTCSTVRLEVVMNNLPYIVS
jgi:hypothetical protein